MQDQPESAEILDAVADFLRTVVIPETQGRTAFQARVALNAIELVKRQIGLADVFDNDERLRLTEFLGHEVNVDQGNRELAERIADGRFDLNTPGLVEHLRSTTLAKLAVDQPRYSGYLRALDTGAPVKGN